MTSSNDYGRHRPWDPKGLRAMVVEDSWHIGLALKNLLQAWGVNVAGPVATTADAERLISEQVPDVAIVDLSLRGDEWAYDLIDRLHEKAVRVIVTTGYSDVQAMPGMAAILRKPFSEEQLFAALNPHCPPIPVATREAHCFAAGHMQLSPARRGVLKSTDRCQC